MAITRPQDAVCTALPIGVMVVLKLRRQQWWPWLLAFGPVLLGAMPFLVTQGIFDHAVTGSFFHTPTTLYNETYWPATLHGFRPVDPQFHQPSRLLQFERFFEWMRPQIDEHARDGFLRTIASRLPMVLTLGPAAPLLLLLSRWEF